MLFSRECDLQGGKHEAKLKKEDERERRNKKEPRERPHPHPLGSEGREEDTREIHTHCHVGRTSMGGIGTTMTSE